MKKPICIRLREKDAEKIKNIAKEQERTPSELIRIIVEKYLEK